MSKSRKIKSKFAKSQFVLNEQRIRFAQKAKSVLHLSGVSVKKISPFVQKRPFVSFFIVLLLLALLIILGSTVFKTKPVVEEKSEGIKQVETFKIGPSPKITVQAQVEKTGVIQIVAQSPGIVWAINSYEGELVNQGKNLITLSNNYYGGNAPALQRQIAQGQYELSKSTLTTQAEIIQKQKQVAQRTDASNDEMRDIANKSLEETRFLLDQNEALLSQTNLSISDLKEATSPADLSNPVIFQANSLRSQLQAVVNQLRQAIRSTELQAGTDRPPADLSNLQREITLKNLEIQEKSLLVNHEVAKLQLALARVNEANMYPSSPFKGVVEKVHVRVGESVNPGTVLVTISGVEGKIILDAKVPAQTAKNLSKLENSEIQVNGKTIQAMPAYVSTEATSGQLYSVIYHIEEQYQEFFTDKQFVNISIPVGAPDSNSIIPFIPLDAIFQTQEESIVYLVKDGKATARKIELGQVQGSFVAVEEGIGNEDEIITTRNVVEGDIIKINQ